MAQLLYRSTVYQVEYRYIWQLHMFVGTGKSPGANPPAVLWGCQRNIEAKGRGEVQHRVASILNIKSQKNCSFFWKTYHYLLSYYILFNKQLHMVYIFNLRIVVLYNIQYKFVLCIVVDNFFRFHSRNQKRTVFNIDLKSF